MSSLPPLPLPEGITERQVESPGAGLSFHVLEAGSSPSRDRPLLLLLHGYPEIAFSWRKIMPTLAKAGYYVVAVDQRGYGRTTGWDTSEFHKTDLSSFTMTTLVRDMLYLINALGYHSVHCVIGHDFGAVSAAMSVLMRPDFFKALITMSHPFKSPPDLPFNTANEKPGSSSAPDVHEELAKLNPPRKHYKWYNSTAPAADDWIKPAQGMTAFLRGYFHLKSADWAVNKPHQLEAWRADQLAKMPEYYIMRLEHTMPEAIHANMANEDERKTSKWLSDDDLAVYVQEWSRTGFQGGLNWYRSQSSQNPANAKDMALFAGRKIETPAKFISGKQDWGNYQEPGAIDKLDQSCTQFKGTVFIEGAGHWPQQEQPEKVADAILEFVNSL